MTAGDWRYCALIVGGMFGGMILMGLLASPLLSGIYAIAYYIAYTQYPWLHGAAERITKRKQERQ